MTKLNPRPTKEELKAIETEALEEGKKQNPPTKEELLEKEVEENLTKEKVEEEDETVLEPEEEEAEPEEDVEEEQEEEPEEEEPPKQDLKKKLSASARENQKILAKNRKMTQALADAEDIPEPTEEEIITEYGKDEYEIMSDTEKKFAKEALMSKKWRGVIAQAKEQASKIDKWNEEVADFINDPQTLIDNPKLEGSTNEFIGFATKDEHNNVPINILVSAFLHEKSIGKKVNKGSQFQKAGGGPNTKPVIKSEKISLDDARILKANDYDEYKRQLRANNIDLGV